MSPPIAVQELSPYAALLTGPTTVANLFGHILKETFPT